MKVPRPSGGSRQSNGVGKIYVKYDTPESARKALQALAGRKFADRTVVTTYFSEVSLPPTSYGLEYANSSIGELRGRRMVRLVEKTRDHERREARNRGFSACNDISCVSLSNSHFLEVLLASSHCSCTRSA